MKDYFDFEREDEIPENELTQEYYCRKHPGGPLSEALDFDREFINKILNKDEIEDADKYILSGIVESLCFDLFTLNESSKDFEELLIEVMGDEWYNNMTSKLLQRLGNKFAMKVGCPELMNNKGIYVLMPGGDKE